MKCLIKYFLDCLYFVFASPSVKEVFVNFNSCEKRVQNDCMLVRQAPVAWNWCDRQPVARNWCDKQLIAPNKCDRHPVAAISCDRCFVALDFARWVSAPSPWQLQSSPMHHTNNFNYAINITNTSIFTHHHQHNKKTTT